MPITTHYVTPEGLYLETPEGRMLVTPQSERIVRVRYTTRPEFSNRKSLMIVDGERQAVPYKVEEEDAVLRLRTAAIEVTIDKRTCAFAYYDSEGSLLTREPSRGGKTLVPVDVVVSVFDEEAELEAGQGADGLRVRVDNIKKRVDRQAYRTKLEFEWAEGEALYGLGSHEEGMFNLRGQHQYLYQQNMKAVVPVIVSTKGYGVLIDSYSYMTFHDDAFGSYLSTDVDDEMDYYILYGPELDEIVQGIRTLTGKAPMLPKWSYGYVQSKERYTSQEELIEIVREYRARKLPLDCIVLDWKSWTGELWGQKTFDPDRFPDTTRMMEELHDMDARLMVSIWPIMNPNSDNHREMAEHDGLLGNRATYDAFSERARDVYWKQAYEGIFSHGTDAWWCDCTEPFEADWKDPVRPEPEKRMRINTEEAKLYLDPEYINAYSLLHSRGIYEGQRRANDAKRVVNLTRSAYAGQHRYGTITWSGDISANWETLRKQIPDGLNFCATGSPYWTLDIGAFFVRNKPELWFWSGDYDDGVQDLGYRELYVRWFQYGAFLPMFRSHGTDTPREIWRFGEPGEPFYDTLVDFLHLRYKLLPYIYSHAAQVYLDDYTLMRALPFDFRHDANVYDIKDQYMFGSAFLVCPVTEPMYFEAQSKPIEGVRRSRSVYLPAGSSWHDFWSGDVIEGGRTIEAETPLERIPVYVRSGSIVPMAERLQHSGDRTDDSLYIRIYAGQDGAFDYYEDEGDGYHYEQGSYAVVRMRWNDAGRTLSINGREGEYPGMPERRELVVLLYQAQEAVQEIRLTYTGESSEVRF